MGRLVALLHCVVVHFRWLGGLYRLVALSVVLVLRMGVLLNARCILEIRLRFDYHTPFYLHRH